MKTILTLSRVIDVPRHSVWKAWTTPAYLEQWFCPRPYSARVVTMDVRAGGSFYVQILDPNGQILEDSPGCYLEVVENERLIWTSALKEGYCPKERQINPEGCDFPLTVNISLEAIDEATTRYTAQVLHANAEDAKKHEEMGFYDGWGAALDQLVELVKARFI